MTTIQEINSSIMFGDLTNDHLDSILSAITYRRTQLIRQNRNTFTVGTEVQFTSARTGQTMIGLVRKVNRKNMTIQVGSRMWQVPATMLSAVQI